VLAGFPDGRADEGPSAGPATLAGLRLATEGDRERTVDSTDDRRGGGPASGTGYGPRGGPSESDAPAETAASDPASSTPPTSDEKSENA
jgi:NADH-quinone oxidoreductase subunit E